MLGSYQQTQKLNYFVQHQKKKQSKEILFNSSSLYHYPLGFHPQPQNLEPLLQFSKLQRMKILLGSFYLNGCNLGFSFPHSKVGTILISTTGTWPRKVLLNSFRLNGQTIGLHPQTQNLEPLTLYSITNTTTGKYCSVAFT